MSVIQLPRRERTPDRPGPGPAARRAPPQARSDGASPRRRDPHRRLPGDDARGGHRAGPGAAVRHRRRRPPDRLERDGADRRAARALVRRRANGEHLAPARHVGFDDLRHRRPAQVGRRRGGRPRRRSRRRDGEATSSPWRRSATPIRPSTATGNGRAAARAPPRARAGAERRADRADLLRRRLRARSADGCAAVRSSSPSPTSAGRSTGGGRCFGSRARHDVVAVEIRDPREDELPNIGTVWLVDPETRRAAPGRHARPAHARAICRGSRRRADRGRAYVPLDRRAARRRLHLRRLASRHSSASSRSRRCGDDLRHSRRARRARTRPAAAPRLPPRAAAPVALRAALHQPAAARERRRRDAPVAPSRTGAARARVAHGADRRSSRGRRSRVAVPRKEGTVILAIDRSGSMLATDVSPSRMAAARAAAATFIRGPAQRASRSGSSRSRTRPTSCSRRPSDHDAAVRALTGSRPTTAPPSGTRSPAPSISVSRASMRRSPGRAHPSSSCSFRTAPARPATRRRSRPQRPPRRRRFRSTRSRSAPTQGTITITTADGQKRLYRVPPDPATLSAVAETTGGKFFEAADAKSLQSVYSRIGSQVGTQVEEHEVTAVLTGVGAVLLLAGSALSLAWFNRLP